VFNKDVVLDDALSHLDQVRGVLFAAANRGNEFFDAVSTQSIKFALARRGRDLSPAKALEELYLVGDVQSLGRGRWLPCTTSAVEVGQLFVVVSGMPTPMLSRVLGSTIFGSGVSRLAEHLPPDGRIGAQAFGWWCGAPNSTADWTTRILKTAKCEMDILSPVEYFNHWDRFVSHRWSQLLPRSAPSSGIVVAREKGPVGTLYYLCKVVNRKAVAYQEFSKDWNDVFRLGFGLRALAGNAATFKFRDIDTKNIELVVPKFLPSAERKVLRALGETRELEGTSQLLTRLPFAALHGVETMLRGLGLSNGVGHL
jgi:hypothetical protein